MAGHSRFGPLDLEEEKSVRIVLSLPESLYASLYHYCLWRNADGQDLGGRDKAFGRWRATQPNLPARAQSNAGRKNEPERARDDDEASACGAALMSSRKPSARVIACDDLALTFAPRELGPAQLVARPEVHFLHGAFAGLCLRSFSVWSRGSEPHLTFPRSISGYQFLTCSRLVVPDRSEEAERRVRELILEALGHA